MKLRVEFARHGVLWQSPALTGGDLGALQYGIYTVRLLELAIFIDSQLGVPPLPQHTHLARGLPLEDSEHKPV